MTFVICDDEYTSRRILENILYGIMNEKAIDVEVVQYVGPAKLLESNCDACALIFLDIYLGEANGMEIAKNIRRNNQNVPIVFVTSSKEHAVESYEVDAFGYLVKPIDPDKVRRIIDKWLLSEHKRGLEKKHLEYSIKDTRGKEKFRIALNKIEYFESNNTSILLHLANGHEIRTYGKLNDIEKELSAKNFLRCHQSYLINMEQIEEEQESCFLMKSGQMAYIRKRDRSMIKRKYHEYKAEQ